MGTAGELRIVDATGTVSRAHAELELVEEDGEEHLWELRDLQSKNGLRFNGKLCRCCLLWPGVEVSLGSLRLIAESEQLMRLFSLLRCLLGWAPERQAYVDQAAWDLRYWAAERTELVIVGDGDLVPVVRRLHRLVMGESGSLLCEPSGGDAAAVVRAIRAAVGGTLCVRVERVQDAQLVVERWFERAFGDRPRLIFCAAEPAIAATIRSTLAGPTATIHVPPLESRVGELEALLQAYTGEVARELRLAASGLTPHDLWQLRAQAFHSLAEIEKTALWLVTLRTWGVLAGAARLGLDPVSLQTWAERLGLAL
jgi:hypothetical protein